MAGAALDGGGGGAKPMKGCVVSVAAKCVWARMPRCVSFLCFSKVCYLPFTSVCVCVL